MERDMDALEGTRRVPSRSTRAPARLAMSVRILVLTLFATASSACGDPSCPTAADLQADLDAAAPGDVVPLGACRVEGALVVPPGVSLAGEGSVSVLAGAGGRVVTLETAAGMATALRDVRIESSACGAVVATGGGEASVEGVEVVVNAGVGIAVEEATLVLRDVSVVGPIDEADLDRSMPALPPFSCATGAASHGLVAVDATLDAERADVRGFEAFGALLVRSTTTWSESELRANLGVGLEVLAGSAELTDLTLARASFGAAAIEAYDGIFVDGAIVNSTRLSAMDGSTYGLFHADGVSASHTDATVTGNGFAGVWTQGGGSLTLEGATVTDNAFAGVATFDNPALEVLGSTIGETRESAGVFGLRTVTAADGLHLIRSAGAVEGTELRRNERVGLLLDLDGGSTADYAFDSVIVEGVGAELGAIAQNGTVAPGWDAAIDRLGDTAVNDPAFASVLDIAGAVGPPCLPPVDGVAVGGIGTLVGP